MYFLMLQMFVLQIGLNKLKWKLLKLPLNKTWTTLKSLAEGKNHFATVWLSEVLATLAASVTRIDMI